MPLVPLRDRSLDLADLVESLKDKFKARLPSGYLQGKTEMRDAVADLLDCSMLEAEVLVDQLESWHMIRYEGDPREPPTVTTSWTFSKEKV